MSIAEMIPFHVSRATDNPYMPQFIDLDCITADLFRRVVEQNGRTEFMDTVRTFEPDRLAMTFDLERIFESKQTFRRNLAGLPVAQKLAMLDALRDRTLAIRQAVPCAPANELREQR